MINYLRQVLYYILAWAVAFNLLIILRFSGFQGTGLIGEIDPPISTLFAAATTAGIVVGFLFSIVDIYLNPKVLKRSILYMILLKTVVFIVAIVAAIPAAVTVSVLVSGNPLSNAPNAIATVFWEMETSLYVLYTLIISGLFYYNRQVTIKLGSGNLINILLGKYRRPKEEDKIFMFLDLTSASAIAERLDPHLYSSFLRDFFFDLDDEINDSKGSVFQFVGDEVVIIWNPKEGSESNNCINFFFRAKERVHAKKSEYLSKYGLFPDFKAGIHYGKVITTEVGGTKREIAYHGDTVNTAARIRSICHDVNKRLLISAELLSILYEFDKEYSVESIGVRNLRGKKNVIGLFSVIPKGDFQSADEAVETASVPSTAAK